MPIRQKFSFVVLKRLLDNRNIDVSNNKHIENDANTTVSLFSLLTRYIIMIRYCNIHVFVLAFFAAANLFAGHPLITDDTDTQGTGTLQIEFTPEYESCAECGAAEIPLTFTYGIFDNADFVVGVPYMFVGIAGDSPVNYGFSDISFEIKWNFYKTILMLKKK